MNELVEAARREWQPMLKERFRVLAVILVMATLIGCIAGCKKETAKAGVHLVLEVDKSELTEEEAEGATDRALEIIRSRMHQFGVTKPLLKKEGRNQIIVQLPGMVDRERAKTLVGRTAQLEFRLVEDDERTDQTLQKIDIALAEGDTTLMPLLSSIEYLQGDLVVAKNHVRAVRRMLSSSKAAQFIPPDEQFLWGKYRESLGDTYAPLYLVKKEAVLTGAAVADARASSGRDPGVARVDLTLNIEATDKWAQVTGDNVGRRIAIILDGIVQSAPMVRQRISSGRCEITMGGARIEEARDLAIALKAGALPAPVRIVEERLVDPSLEQK